MATEGWVRPKHGALELIARLNEMFGADHVDFQPCYEGVPRRRYLHHLARWGTRVQFRVHCNDVQTSLRGLLERVFFHWEVIDGVPMMVRPHRPDSDFVHQRLGQQRSDLLKLCGPVAPLTRAQFLAPLGGSKLARYTKAADSVEERPIERKDAFLDTFVKAEKLNVTAKEDPDPRVIQPRSARYCYAVGLYIKACEHPIYHGIDRMFGRRTVMKGLNADQRGRAFSRAWDEFVHPCAVGLDASRFDQHVSMSLLAFEHSIYNSMFHSPELKRLLKMQLVNTGHVRCPDGHIKYTVEGSRMSGDMNTSLGNVLLMCLMVRAYLTTKPFKIALLNDGDDCVLIMEAAHVGCLDDLPTWFAELGMVMKVEPPVYVLEEVEFCQAHPVRVSEGVWRMVRDPRIVMSKDLCVVRPVRDVGTWNRYRLAIGECGLALAGDVPIFCEFYNSLIQGAVVSDRSRRKMMKAPLETGMEYLARGMHRKYREPESVARVSFCLAFGIWPDLQVAIENVLRGKIPLWRNPDIVEHVANEFALL